MHDFDWDVMQKKRTAHSARRMKNGSKSRKCSLPSDHLTPAQLKRRNGPMTTYNLKAPMSYAELKAMPTDLQVAYLIYLQETYHTTDAMLGKMLGVSGVSVFHYRNKIGVAGLTRERIGADERAARNKKWEAFCHGYENEDPVEETVEIAETPAPVMDCTEAVDKPEVEDTIICDDGINNVEDLPMPDIEEIQRMIATPLVVETKEMPKLTLSDLTATFKGEFDAQRFLKWLTALPMPDGYVKIRVEVTTDE